MTHAAKASAKIPDEQELPQLIVDHLTSTGPMGLLPQNLTTKILSALDPASSLPDTVTAGVLQIVIFILAAQRQSTHLQMPMDDLCREVDTYSLMLQIERERRAGAFQLSELPTLHNVLDGKRVITFTQIATLPAIPA